MFTAILASVVLLLVLLHLLKPYFKHPDKLSDVPAVGGRWPVFGNLFDMSRTHTVLTDWSKQYGGVFRFNMYGEEIVVLNDFESIHEALVSRGSDFAGRPRMSRTDYQNRNVNSVVWQTYTPKLQVNRNQVFCIPYTLVIFGPILPIKKGCCQLSEK